MSGKNRKTIRFPDGLIFAGSDDAAALDESKKKVDFKGALNYARKAWEEGKEVTFEEMQRFVSSKDMSEEG